MTKNSLPRLEPGALIGDRVYEAIQEAIMRGDLSAGYRLRIRTIADELGTSVMPVREAIRRLEENGLAESVPYRGAIVKSFTNEELLEVYAARMLLEVEAARLGAEHATADTATAMRQEYRLMREALEAADVVAYLDRDERLLELLYQASGNNVIVEMIRILWRRCRSYKIVGAQRALESENLDQLSSYQDRLIAAAARNDAEEAAAVNSDSLEAATDRIRSALAHATAAD